jgi:hypothetical protein
MILFCGGFIQTTNDKGITEGQRRGASGESYVEARLKSYAQVLRPVPLLEYAIDFFCRLLQNGKPSDKIFAVEVKSTDIFKDYYSESIEKDVMKFWLTQPFPVYVVVYEESSDNCYWTSVEDNRGEWTNELLKDKKSITIRIDRAKVLGKNQNDAFIQKVEQDIITVNAIRGIPQFVTKGYEGYAIGYIPFLKLSDAARVNITLTIRYGFNYLIKDSILRGDVQSAYSLGKLLADFDHGHYDHFVLLAGICRQLGKKEEAKANYEVAIQICKSDPNWDKKRLPDAPYIGEIIRNIEYELRDLMS